MSKLSTDIIFYNILSRVPVASLARFRLVSKLWCKYIDDDPHFAIVHNKLSKEPPTPILYGRNNISFHVIEIEDYGTILEAKREPCLDFVPYVGYKFKISGSCNGLLYISEHYMPCDRSMVIHPLTKQCFKLPPMEPPLKLPYDYRYQSSGLGFDAFTNTFKVVCVRCPKQIGREENLDQVNKNLRTMVHDLGTGSWREIPTVPIYPISGEGVFAHGRLHWLVGHPSQYHSIYIYHDRPSEDRRDVISFDVTTEEFGLINPPKATTRRSDCWLHYKLVDLHGEVGYAHSSIEYSIELWVLKKTEWAVYCCFDRKPSVRKGVSVKVLGRWNKDGDLLISSDVSDQREFFIYCLKNDRFHRVEIVDGGDVYAYNKADIYMYPSCSVFSIRGTKKTASSITNSIENS